MANQKWSDRQNTILFALCLVEAVKPGSFDIHMVRVIVGRSEFNGREELPESRFQSVLWEAIRSVPHISPAVQVMMRCSYDKNKFIEAKFNDGRHVMSTDGAARIPVVKHIFAGNDS